MRRELGEIELSRMEVAKLGAVLEYFNMSLNEWIKEIINGDFSIVFDEDREKANELYMKHVKLARGRDVIDDRETSN